MRYNENSGVAMRFLSYLLTLALVMVMSACGGGGGSAGTSSGGAAPALITTMPSSLTLAPGETGTFQVSGGSPPYVVSSGNVSVVAATGSGSNVSVTGVGLGGPVKVQVMDASGKTVSADVTVAAAAPLITTMPPSLTLAPGETGTYHISGGSPPYVVSSGNASLVAATGSGSNVSVTGIGLGGPVRVQVMDASGITVSADVTVAAAAPLITTMPPSLTLALGETGTYQVSGGSPPYVVSSSNVSLVAATGSGSNVSVRGVGLGGPVIVQVMDAGGKIVNSSVVVAVPAPLTTTAPGAVTIATGQSGSYTISGGVPPYVVTSSNAAVATAFVNGNAMLINGVNNGLASLVVSDSKGSSTVKIDVTVAAAKPLLVNVPSSITMGRGVSNSFLISGGTPPYSAVSANPALVSTSVTGSVLSVSALLSGGPISIVVSDAQGANVNFSVTVPAPGALFTTAPPAITVASGQANSFSISGGVPPYIVSSSNQSVATAGVSGSFLTITGAGPGNASVVITDSMSSTPITVAVTVPAPNSLYTTAPSALTIAPGQSPSYLVSGGFPPYTATSSNQAVAGAGMSGSILTISGNSPGPASVVISDSKGTVLTISVAVGSSTALYVNAPSSVSMSAGTSTSFTVGGGSQPYSVSSSDARIATGSISGSTLTITAVKAGVVTLQVFDASGKSVTISVTVDGSSGSSAVASIDLLPSANTLPSAAGSTVTFLVTVKDASNNTVPGQTVTFRASSGNLVVPTPAVTGASGSLANVALSPGSDASLRVITVTASVGSVTKSITIPVVGTTVSISGPGSTLMGSTGLAYALKAVDSAGKPIPGATLTLSSFLGNPIAPQSTTTDVAGAASVSYTATVAGTDTLTVSGLGASASTSVTVSNEDFAFTAPAVATNMPVSTPNAVTVRYRLNGVGVAGQLVNFSATRGTISPASAVTDANGFATVSITSSTAGPVTISAQLGTARATLAAAFVATTPATLYLQANPSAVFPNASGSVNQSALSATVRDAVGNPVAGQVVNFTALTDPSNGFITPGSTTTDASGIAVAQFVPGALSTPANGVVLKATVQGTGISSTASLTVSGSALFISIGLSNDLTVVDRNTYAKSFSVYVTDVNGAPVGNKAVTLSVYPPIYRKGRLVYDSVFSNPAQWVYSNTSPTQCANEDVNRNGILDSGEDTNGNGLLTPGLPVLLSPAALTTDANGYATFLLNYGKNYAVWLDTQITARTSVGGTESSKTIAYALEMLAADALSSSSPANVVSPFGTATLCTNPN